VTPIELLGELRRNILRDVSDAVSADDADYLWSDPSLMLYINEGYFRFCQLTEYLHDATTPAVCVYPVVLGQIDYPLHPSVLRVVSAAYNDKLLPVVSHDFSTGDLSDFSGLASPHAFSGAGVFAVVPDYETGSLRLMGTPTAEDVGKEITLRVTRYPLAKLTLEAPDVGPEIPERFHLDMLEWAAFRALRNHDHDGENMAKASAHSTRFERAIEEVKQEVKARRFSRMGYTGSWRWY